ncbi:MAG: ATP/GTP-binding protein [Polaromonas sp.]|nr:ATP/GTP-binding protein [Polaromonas sp.]
MQWNILFMGPVGAGKTKAIHTISDIEVVNTDARATDETQLIKSSTTVSMDVGTLQLAGNDKLRLYGAPGQERFDFMWDILLTQSRGVILTLNHNRPDPVADLNQYLHAIEERMLRRKVPIVIAVTHVDLQPDRPLSIYSKYLQHRGCTASEILPPVLEMDARDKKHVRATLIAITALLEMAERFSTGPTCHRLRASGRGPR